MTSFLMIAFAFVVACLAACDSGGCIRESECNTGLVCRAGVCVVPPRDGGVTPATDAGRTYPDASFPVTFDDAGSSN